MRNANIKNQKGFSLMELLIALLILTVISTLVTTLFISGANTFRSLSEYTRQQERILDAVTWLRRDFEECKSITFTMVKDEDGNRTAEVESVTFTFPGTRSETRTWMFVNDTADPLKDNVLQCNTEIVLKEVDTPESRFIYISSLRRFSVVIRPVQTNIGVNRGLNIKVPLVYEFVLDNKAVLEN